MTIRYLLCPGPMVSRQDGQTYHIGAGQLASLYGVPMSQCIILTPNMPRWVNRVDTHTLIRLVPLATGDYPSPLPGVSPPAPESEPGSTCGFPPSGDTAPDEPDFRSGGGGDFGGGGATGSWGAADD